MNRFLPLTVFLAGLAAVAWVGAGYVGVNLLALAVTLLIGAFYLVGALELRRYQQATDSLTRALADLPQPPPALGPWLDQLHPALRNAVRLRVEGERVGLPGPALAPYLTGLLVLLGMLGTFVGMVVTLQGTGFALESATDLQAIRNSLAAPVKGLGVAFGTSLAGIATSAMLGLLSALCRRERLQAGQWLDARAATTLRAFSQAHQREESLRLLQRQAEAMPTLVDRLQAMMAALEQQSQALHTRLADSQDHFHGRTEAAYAGLAASVDRTLKESLTESARLASAAFQPVAEATMAGVAREAAALHHGVAQSVQQQLDGIATRFDASTVAVAQRWDDALAAQQRSNTSLSSDLRGALEGFSETFTQRSATLVEGVAARLAETTDGLSHQWRDALVQHASSTQALSADTQHALAQTAAGFAQQTTALLDGVQQAHADLQARSAARDDERLTAWTTALAQHEQASLALARNAQQALTATTAGFDQHATTLLRTVEQAHGDLHATLAARDEQRLTAWTDAMARHERASLALSTDTQQALASTAAGFEQHAAALQHTIDQAHATLQTQWAARDEQRLAGWTTALGDMATALRSEWQQAGAEAAARQQDICSTLADTARDIGTHTRVQAQGTLAEIGRLVEAAAAAPRAAAEVIGELRAKLSDSLAHDNAMLEERTRVMDTLRTLLDAVNHASTEQRSAIDALVGGSAELLERVGTRFAERVEAETGKLDGMAAQLTGSAVEVASLGEAFGQAVQLFSDTSTQLSTQLQGIEAALGKSLARSDEQLAYYVAQAREVIDLSMLSQQQIVEDLQQLARQRATEGSEA